MNQDIGWKKLLLRIASNAATAWLAFCGVVDLHYILLVTTWASFDVPSGSMRPTLQIGDYLLVNKWA